MSDGTGGPLALVPDATDETGGKGGPLALVPDATDETGGTGGPLALVPDAIRAMARYEVPHPPGIVAKLDANESPFALAPDIAAELGGVLAGVALHRYPAGDSPALRALISREHDVAPDALVFGNGSDELIALVIAAFSRAQGAARPRVVYPSPSFAVYRIAAASHGADAVEVPLCADFTLDEAALAGTLAAAPANVVFFALPNNPTGTLFPPEAVLATAAQHPDVVVVSDEAYFEYAGVTLLGELPRYPNLVVLRTVSKIGLAALRCGYLVAHPDLAREVEKVRPPYNLGSLNQVAAAWLLERHGPSLRARAAEVVAERDRLAVDLAAIVGVTLFPSRANFLLFRVADARACWTRLVERGVLVRNLDRPGALAGCLRVTVGTREENELFLSAQREAMR